MLRVLVSLSIVLANVAACSKKADPPGSPPAGSASGSAGSAGSASGSTGSAAGSASGSAGSAAAGSATGSADGSAGSSASGSAGSGAAGSAGSGGSGAKYDDPRESELCTKVLQKIFECQKDKEFLTALNEGVDAKQKKLNARLLKEVARWKPAERECHNLAPAIEYEGFLEHWDRIAAVPDLVDSCGKLGTMVNSAGGLFGGDRAY